jgi:hypothetical protein
MAGFVLPISPFCCWELGACDVASAGDRLPVGRQGADAVARGLDPVFSRIQRADGRRVRREAAPPDIMRRVIDNACRPWFDEGGLCPTVVSAR